MSAVRSLCVVLMFAATSLWAQQSPAPPAPPLQRAVAPPATLTFTVEVTDKAGHPVPGLQQSDFTLFDDNSPAPIQSFAAHTPGPASPETAILVFDTVNMGFGGDSVAREQVLSYLRSFHGACPFRCRWSS